MSGLPPHMRAFFVERQAEGDVLRRIAEVPTDQLPQGEVLVAVRFSSLNYKDALAAQGHPGIVKKFPHIPGIDAAGCVLESSSPQWQEGQEVIVTGYELGAGQWGGWAEYVRVPANWPIALPGMRDALWAMTLGTAGLTAALAADALRHEGILPTSGPIVVTGATGGVGSLAVRLLAQLGSEVVAVSGKPQYYEWLLQLGARQVLAREQLLAVADKPLLSARWAGAIDTVGGAVMEAVVRSLRPAGACAVCGLVAGADLKLTVYPFLLRGIKLLGIDSAWCPQAKRIELWNRLATEWYFDEWHKLHRVLDVTALLEAVPQMLAGRTIGRTVVALND